jgi:hypothetical protein
MSPNWFLGTWTLHPPSKVGPNFSRVFYISLSVIQFMLVATSWSGFLCAFILTWVVILFCFILFYRILELNCTWAWQNANECFIYTVWGKKKLSCFPKSELNDLGMQCHHNSESHPDHNTSLCNQTHHSYHSSFENGFWYLQRGAGSHWTFNVLLLKLYSFHPVQLCTNFMVAAGLL